MIYYQKKKEFFFSKPTNLFDLYICIHQAIVCGWIMIIDVVNVSSNILICLSPWGGTGSSKWPIEAVKKLRQQRQKLRLFRVVLRRLRLFSSSGSKICSIAASLQSFSMATVVMPVAIAGGGAYLVHVYKNKKMIGAATANSYQYLCKQLKQSKSLQVPVLKENIPYWHVSVPREMPRRHQWPYHGQSHD